MPIRFPIIFLAVWLLAGVQSIGTHVHWHGHEAEPAHADIVSIFDAGHEAAHAGDTIDVNEPKLGARMGLQPPHFAATVVPSMLVLDLDSERAIHPFPEEPRVTGPPRQLGPPGQAPPPASTFI